MKKRLIITNSIIIFLSLAVMLVVSMIIIYNQNYKSYCNQAKNYLSLTTSIFDGSNFEETEDAILGSNEDIRLTIIDLSGNVIVDTESNVTENHMDRPEIQSENLGKVFSRYSSTKQTDMLYVADIDDNYYVRIAIPQGRINSVLNSFISIGVIALVIILIISVLFTFFFNKKSIEPINKTVIDLSRLAGNAYSLQNITIDDLPIVLNSLTLTINNKISEIKDEKKKITTVLDLLNQGVIVIDKDFIVDLMNQKAYELFNVNDVIGKSYIYLIRDLNLQGIINDSINNHTNNRYILNMGMFVYDVSLSFVSDTWISGGVILTVTDITKEVALEKTKKDFFQNASHELKSPLTSIIGFQQMITEGIIDDYNQIKEYSSKTLREANRMNSIIGDMLDLAYLEQDYEKKNDLISVKNLTSDILESLENRIDEKKISLSISLNECKIYGDSRLLDELVRNIIDNAIKYNKENGCIDILLDEEKLVVSDTGIGISDTDQLRIFERFYRADKGRSKDAGGTGLGLAIVKHICDIYNYEISLESTLNKGTKFTVRFK